MNGNPAITVQEYLARIRRNVAQLGPGEDFVVKPEDEQFLRLELANDQKINNGLVSSALVLLYAVFALTALLVWHNRDRPGLMAICFAGAFLSLTLLGRWLRRLWIDKNFIDLIRNSCQHLAPAETAQLISMYYGLMLRNKAAAKAERLQPMRILFLAANPATTSRLDLEEELHGLEAELRGVKYRDQVVLTARHAVRPDDLVRHVRSERPTVVHFSAHGSGIGIVLRNDEGGYVEVTGPSLKRFFHGRGVRLVVLNACFSKAQAEMLPRSVKAVVGTTDAVGDVDARRFTVAFYRALGEGLTIAEAFRDGGDAVVLPNGRDVFWSAGELNEALVNPELTNGHG